MTTVIISVVSYSNLLEDRKVVGLMLYFLHLFLSFLGLLHGGLKMGGTPKSSMFIGCSMYKPFIWGYSDQLYHDYHVAFWSHMVARLESASEACSGQCSPPFWLRIGHNMPQPRKISLISEKTSKTRFKHGMFRTRMQFSS